MEVVLRWSILILLFAGCDGSTPPEPAVEPPPPPTELELAHDFALQVAQRVRDTIPCPELVEVAEGMPDEPPEAFLCDAAGIPGLVDAELPPGPTRLYGVSVPVRPSRPLARTALRDPAMAALEIGDDRVEVRRMKPPTRQLARTYAGAVSRVMMVLLGVADKVSLSQASFEALNGEPVLPRPITSDAGGVAWSGALPTRLYRVEGRGGSDILIAVQDFGGSGYLYFFPAEQEVITGQIMKEPPDRDPGTPVRPQGAPEGEGP